jgi:hypothetical protein
MQLSIRSVSVGAKIAAGVIGLLSGVAWIISAYGGGNAASAWNGIAAILAAVAMFAQSVSAFIDSRHLPHASYAP